MQHWLHLQVTRRCKLSLSLIAGAELLSGRSEGRHLRPLESKRLQRASVLSSGERRMPTGPRRPLQPRSLGPWQHGLPSGRKRRRSVLRRQRIAGSHPGRRNSRHSK